MVLAARRTILTALVAGLAALLALPAGAAAHAELTGTEPGNETTVEAHPDEVEISFSEDVTVPFGAVRVYGPDGSRVEQGAAVADGEVVRIGVEAEDPGTYAVSWRAISADGHPVRGAFVFHVEEQSTDTVSRDAALEASKGSRPTELAFGVARFGVLLGVLVAVGGVLFAAMAAGSWQPRWLRASLVLAIASMLAAYVLDASIAAGLTIIEALEPDVLREQASTVYGGATLVRLGVALVCLVATLLVTSPRWQRPAVRYAVLVPFVALAATLSLSGHAVGDDVTALRLPVDMLHSLAAAAWIGGLVQLVPWSRATPIDAAVLVRWSRAALAAVVVLVVTGSWAAWEEIGLSLDGLVDTTYGRLVLVKVVLLVAAMPLANLNRTRVIPEVRAGGAGATEALRRYVRAEVGILLLVLAATAWLIQTPPAKVELEPPFVEQTVQLDDGGSVQFVVDPANVGPNELHVYAFDERQQVDDSVTGVTLTAWNDERELGPLEIDLLDSGPGHFTTPAATIPFAGEWRFEAGITRGRFDEQVTEFTVDIAPAPA
jgi:copper transport protein